MNATLKLNRGDKITILHSPHVWTFCGLVDDSHFHARQGGANSPRRTFALADVLSIVERASQD